MVRRSRDRLADAAELYYVHGLNQEEVARRLDTTRSNVSRMLQRARDKGVVEFRIHRPLPRQHGLESALAETFDLREAVVLAAQDQLDVLQLVGRLGARWLVDNLKEGTTIALSWGTTLEAVSEELEVDQAYDVMVVQLGGDLQRGSQLSGHDLVRRVAARLGGRYEYVHAPAILESAETAESLRHNPAIAEQLDRARSADLALVGIGGFGFGFSQMILDTALLSIDEAEAFAEAEVAGDICARFFDSHGRELPGSFSERVLAVTLPELVEIPTVVGVACGRRKARAVRAALRGRLVDVLICDQAVAAGALHLEQTDTEDTP